MKVIEKNLINILKNYRYLLHVIWNRLEHKSKIDEDANKVYYLYNEDNYLYEIVDTGIEVKEICDQDDYAYSAIITWEELLDDNYQHTVEKEIHKRKQEEKLKKEQEKEKAERALYEKLRKKYGDK